MHEEMLTAEAAFCPYCNTGFELLVDPSQGSHQTWEDCPCCCAPIHVRVVVSLHSGELEEVLLSRDDDVT